MKRIKIDWELLIFSLLIGGGSAYFLIQTLRYVLG